LKEFDENNHKMCCFESSISQDEAISTPKNPRYEQHLTAIRPL